MYLTGSQGECKFIYNLGQSAQDKHATKSHGNLDYFVSGTVNNSDNMAQLDPAAEIH